MKYNTIKTKHIAATTVAVECTVEFVYTLGGSKSIGGRRLN